MRIGIHLTRRTALKVLAPIASAIQRRGHDLVWRVVQSAVKSGEDMVVFEELGRHWPNSKFFGGKHDVLIGIGSVLPPRCKTPQIAVDHFFDCWLSPRTDVEQVYHSDYHELVATGYGGHSGCIVGWPNSDEVQPAQTRDSVVFFSLKLKVPEPWRRSREGQQEYRKMAEETRDLAHSQGLAFIVKGREKNGDPRWLHDMADAYYTDQHVAPYTSWRLLSRAAWCVHFESGAVYEAACAGSYSIALCVPNTHIIGLPGGSLQYGGGAEMHRWKGVSQYGLPKEGIPTVDSQAREAFIAKFLGPCDGKVGERIVEIAEQLG